MKRALWVIAYGLLLTGFTGCAAFIQPTTKVGKDADVALLPSYSGPKAKVALADFEVKAVKVTPEIGSTLREKLVTALINSKRFSVVDRQTLSADVVITAVVSEFEHQASGGRAGVGGGGGVSSGVLGGLLGPASNKAYMALDIHIIDASNSKILATTRVKGQAADIDKAMYTCIIEAVHYISQTIPQNYYKY